MRWRYLLILILFAVPRAPAQGLPDLGDVAQSDFSPLQERRLGDTSLFVLPSTSPANAAVPWDERLRWFQALHDLVR